MTCFIRSGDCCESQKSQIITRKIVLQKGGLRKDPITQKLMVLYYMDRNSSYEIIEPVQLNKDELEKRRASNIHIEIGDILKADSIRVYADSKRNCLKPDVKEGVSGRHGASLIKASVRTIGIISTPLEIYKNLLGLTSAIREVINYNHNENED